MTSFHEFELCQEDYERRNPPPPHQIKQGKINRLNNMLFQQEY